jgi:hypothetical protein
MAIKFDQLLEALDPSLDEYPDESLGLKESVSQSKSEELYDFLSEIGIKTKDAIDQIPNIDLEELCEYFECDDTIEYPSDLMDILGLDADDILEVILDLISDKDINEYISTVNEYLDESLNESKSSEALLTEIEIESNPGDPYYTGDEKIVSRPGDPYYTGNDEFLDEDFSEDNIDYIGERLSRYIRRNGWDSFFDYPVLAVRDNSGNNRHFVVKSTKNSIIITDGDYKPIYSHELKSKNDLKTIVNEAAKR